MQYMKVRWIHDIKNEPVLLYSEFSDDRVESRKVEIFPCGLMGYAGEGFAFGTTQLAEGYIPHLESIAEDPQFQPSAISREEFETVWTQAILQGSD